MKRLLLCVIAVAFPVICTAEQQVQTKDVPSAASREALEVFLRNYLARPPLEPDPTTEYAAAVVALNNDKDKEVIVYVSGAYWCGTGGCHTLVLREEGASYEVVADITITRPPIRVLSSMSHGWHDIGVWVQGGGIQPGHEVVLSFDGHQYPSNPSALPARPLRGYVSGDVAIPRTDSGAPLYK
jgi:hypothetical protein